MAAYVQVVLQETLKNLGNSGEVVRVRPGYARNFLYPRKLAVVATERNLSRLEHDKREASARAAKLKAAAEETAKKLNGFVVKLSRTVGAEGRMYGSVTHKDIGEALEAAGFSVDRRKIEFENAIKALGSYDVVAKLAHDVTATFKVEVVKAEKLWPRRGVGATDRIGVTGDRTPMPISQQERVVSPRTTWMPRQQYSRPS